MIIRKAKSKTSGKIRKPFWHLVLFFACILVSGFLLPAWIGRINHYTPHEEHIVLDQINLESTKIHIRGNGQVEYENGSKKFLLYKPEDQKQFYYWLLSQFLEREGFLVEGRELVQVSIDSAPPQLYEQVLQDEAHVRSHKPKDDKIYQNELIKAFAIIDLFKAWSSFVGYQVKNGKLRISFKRNSLEIFCDPKSAVINPGPWQSDGIAAWVKLILRDETGWLKYRQALAQVSSEQRINELFQGITPHYKKMQFAYQQLFTNADTCLVRLKDKIYENALYIRSQHLAPTQSVRVNFQSLKNGNLIIKVSNRRVFPVQIKRIRYKEFSALPLTRRDYVLNGKPDQGVMNYQTLAFKFEKNISISLEQRSALKLEYQLLGNDKIYLDIIQPYAQMDEESLLNDSLLSVRKDLKKFPFLKEVGDKLILLTGHWKIQSDLILPAGYLVEAEPGFEVDILNGSRMISFSAVNFSGTAEKPIKIFSSNASGQGLAVLGANKESKLHHVIFENLNTLRVNKNHWALTGAVTFYESPVKFTHCSFIKSRADSSLNIARAQFVLEDSLFDTSTQTALDVNYASGSVDKTQFLRSGKDAVNLTGSEVAIKQVSIESAGGIAISSGENSKTYISGAQLTNVKLGLLCRDSSKLSFDAVSIFNSKIGVASYAENNVFAQDCTINADRLDTKNVKTQYVLEEGSLLVLSDQKIRGIRTNVAKEIDLK